MKKFLTFLAAIAAFVCLSLGAVACGGDNGKLKIYAPDGAPALAIAPVMDEFDAEYTVVNATTIQNFVTGDNPEADICVLPVNLAAKLLGKGENYQMLGTVTHGNLYLLKKGNAPDLTADNLISLVGKTVGVINLAQVPGLTFKVILNDKNIPYADLNGAPAADKVNLKSVNAEEVLPTDTTCDYFVVAEPAATLKTTKTNGKLSFAGNLQELYGGEDGYPQAVVVAKRSLIENDRAAVIGFMDKLSTAGNRITNGEMSFAEVVAAINAHMTSGAESSLNAENLNMQAYNNCAVKFVNAAQSKAAVNAFLEKLIAVSANSAATVSDGFFFIAD